MTLPNIYIVEAKRTPLCRSQGGSVKLEQGASVLDVFARVKNDGAYANISGSELARTAMAAVVSNIDPATLYDVKLGLSNQAGDHNGNLGRFVAMMAEIPYEVPGVTHNRLCASSMDAAISAVNDIATAAYYGQEGIAIIAAGMEQMGRRSMAEILDQRSAEEIQFMQKKGIAAAANMGNTAENLAKKYDISREEQDRFAARSHEKAYAAQQNGGFDNEIVPVDLGNGTFQEQDVGIVNYGSIENALKVLGGKLRPSFITDGTGTVTAGNASPFTDGAAALLICNAEYLNENSGLEPMVRIVSSGIKGVDPNIMGYGPVPATKQALERAGMTLEQIGLIELNEAFAAQSIACLKGFEDMGLSQERAYDIVNVKGGAIALGHPLGCSGARILATLAYAMNERPDVQYGLAAMCIGEGQGAATIVENCSK